MSSDTAAKEGGGLQNPLLTAPLWRSILRLAGPMFAGAMLQNAQSLIDLFWVGRLGPDAVAALALAGTLLMTLFPVIMGLATGTVALVARSFGAGDARQASYLAAQSLLLACIMGVSVGLLCLPLLEPACRLLGAEPAVVNLAVKYLRVTMVGFVSGTLLFISNSALQGAGNTLAPMGAMLLANLLNLALDPLFIFGWGWIPGAGVAGAAYATVLSQFMAAIVVIAILLGGRTRLHPRLGDFRPHAAAAWRLLRIGLPSVGQMMSRSLMSLVFFRIVARYGTFVVAGYGIGMRFHMVILMPCFVLGNATATLVGQHMGAAMPGRARRAAWTAAGIVSLFMVISALAMWLWAMPAVAWFNGQAEVIRVGSSYLRTVTPFYIFAGVSIVLGRALNGAGSTIPTLILTLVALWGLQVPLALLLARVVTPPMQGIWWAIAIATTVHGCLAAAWFELKRWQRVSV